MRYLKTCLPVFIWMAVIFFASTDIGSLRNTSRIVGPIVRWFKPAATESDIKLVQAIARKTGHVTEYAILAVLLWRAHRGLRGSFREWRWKEFFGIVALCSLYACTDEFHQRFVASRMSSPEDVLIDTAGACLGLLAVFSVGRYRKIWNSTAESESLPAGSSPQSS